MGEHAEYADPLPLPIQEPIHNLQTKVQMTPFSWTPWDSIALESQSVVFVSEEERHTTGYDKDGHISYLHTCSTV